MYKNELLSIQQKEICQKAKERYSKEKKLTQKLVKRKKKQD